jgi:hypothetical protein
MPVCLSAANLEETAPRITPHVTTSSAQSNKESSSVLRKEVEAM